MKALVLLSLLFTLLLAGCAPTADTNEFKAKAPTNPGAAATEGRTATPK